MTHAPTVIISRTAAALAGFGRRVEVPNKLGSVSLIKPLGEGGMSVVHLGRHEILQLNVAVKFLLDIPASDQDPRFTTFLEGAKAAAAIKHPGLNVIYHADAIQGIPYLVMELIEGPTLADLLREHGAMPLNIARAVIENSCAAVGELHDHGIIHRDIKPANIMIDPTGRVVVTDFGLAMQRPAALFGGSAGGVTGTPCYMAPEMFEANVSSRTDVYAMGVTIFELLTGKPPFSGDFQDLRLAHRTTQMPIASLAERAVPESIIVLIERAMHKDTLFRPKSARHVLDAFSKACDAAGINRATDAQIQRYMEVGHGGATAVGSVAATPTPAYYQRLNTLAEVKRRTEGTISAEPEPAESQSPSVVADLLPAASAGVQEASKSPGAPPAPAATPRRFARSAKALPTGVAIPAFAILTAVCVALAYDAGARIGAVPSIVLLGGTLFFSWWLFIRLVLCRPVRDGVTRCGWCGIALKNLRDMRCTECGRLIGAARAERDVPVASQWATRLKLYGIAIAVFIALLAVWGPACVKWLGVEVDDYTPRGFLALVAVILPGAVGSLLALHYFTKGAACLTGRTCCGQCGGDLAGITKPECPTCGRHI